MVLSDIRGITNKGSLRLQGLERVYMSETCKDSVPLRRDQRCSIWLAGSVQFSPGIAGV